MKTEKIEKFRYLLRQIEREIFELYKEDAQCCGISMAQCHALMELGNAKEITISDLADQLRLDKSTLSRTVDSLVQKGFVSREISQHDRRFMSVQLTKSGMDLYKSINHRYNEIFQETLKDVSQKQQDQLLESLTLFIRLIIQARNSDSIKESGYCQS